MSESNPSPMTPSTAGYIDETLSRRDSLILVHLPFDQHSKLFVRPGVSAKDAILPILKKRNIIPDLCTVRADEDAKSPEIDLQIGLEDLSESLKGQKELWVHAEYKDWEIPYDKVAFKERVGSGTFGTVYKAEYFGVVAVKRLNIAPTCDTSIGLFKTEADVLRKTRHPNVLNFVGVICRPELAIVTEWCSGESLYRQIHVNDPPMEFTPNVLIRVAKQLSQGMEYLHARTVLHRDLKSSNVFLTEGLGVKIGDFGLASMRSITEGSDATSKGSVLWMAPEVIRHLGVKSTLHRYRMTLIHASFSPRSDVYSFGVCLYEMFTRRLPYGKMRCRDQILYMVGSGLMRPELDNLRTSRLPDLLIKLYHQCVAFEMDDRPEFKAITEALSAMGGR